MATKYTGRLKALFEKPSPKKWYPKFHEEVAFRKYSEHEPYRAEHFCGTVVRRLDDILRMRYYRGEVELLLSSLRPIPKPKAKKPKPAKAAKT